MSDYSSFLCNGPTSGYYSPDQIKENSHYYDPIDNSPLRPAGNSRRPGDVSVDVQTQVVDALLSEAQSHLLSESDTALLISIVRAESGFNPDAASNESATGVGQLLNGTRKDCGVPDSALFDIPTNARGAVDYFVKCKGKVDKMYNLPKVFRDAMVYKFYHDGLYSENKNYDGFSIYFNKGKVNDWLTPIQYSLYGTIPNDIFPAGIDIPPDVSSDFDSASKYVRRCDPLTLDLDGDGIETRALVDLSSGASSKTPVYFDYDGNGAKANTGWISPHDGMLVLDRNGNGTIDNGSELFSNFTPLNNGGTAANGIYALKQEDTNKDGVVNNLDANWSNLKIWRDLNSDGISQSEELYTLEELGITGLSTNTTNKQYTFTKSDGTTNNMADVNLPVDTFHQQFTNSIPVLPDVEALPDMEGSGLVRSLQEAASLSPTLADLLTQYSQATTRNEQLALMDQLLLAWADTSGLIATLEERNRTTFPLYNSYTGQEGAMLHILEAFNGRYFFTFPYEKQEGASAVTGIQHLVSYYLKFIDDRDGHLDYEAWNVPYIPEQNELLHQSYDALRESVYESLFYQTRFQTVFVPLLDKIEFVVGENNQITWDYTQLQQYFTDAIAANPATGLSDLLEFNRYLANNFLPLDWQGNELFADYCRTMPTTPELQAMYDSYKSYLHILGTNTTYYAATSTNGEEIIAAGNTSTQILGNAGNDIIMVGDGNDTLFGNAGNDYLSGSAGNDAIYSADGDDALIGGAGNDALYGNAGNDALIGSEGSDTLYGGLGDDTLDGGVGNDIMIGCIEYFYKKHSFESLVRGIDCL